MLELAKKNIYNKPTLFANTEGRIRATKSDNFIVEPSSACLVGAETEDDLVGILDSS